MRKIEPELITGMGYIGATPGVLYRMTPAGKHLTVSGGSSVVVNGAKDNAPFDSLTLYGHSAQGSTTGAQLLDINNLTDVSGYPNTAIAANGGLSKRNEDLSSPDRYLINVIPNTAYSISAVDFVNGAVLQISDLYQKGESESVLDVRIYAQRKQVEFNSGKYEQLTLSFFSSQLNTDFKATHIMLNAGSAALPWEPYTGGKPSPSPEYPQEIESAGQDGEIGVSVQGGNLLDMSEAELRGYNIYNVKAAIKAGQTYTFTNGINAKNNVKLLGIKEDGTEFSLTKLYLAPGKSETFVPQFDASITLLGGSNEETNLYGKYALNMGNTALPYEPYKPLQTAILKTPDGLPGIPVSSGGNYTDADGQQWVCDTIEYKRGVAERVQRVKTVTLDGSEVWEIGKYDYFSCSKKVDTEQATSLCGFAKNIRVVKHDVIDNTADVNVIAHTYFWRLRLEGVDIKKGATTDDLKAFLSINPITVYYAAKTPIRTPLTPEELAQLKALHTYSPTTTVLNDAGAGMGVGYVADTKLYIDKKIDEMMIALANTQARLL